MKTLMIAAIALSAGFAGMTQEASAGHREARKRAATRRIVGGILDLTLGGRYSYRRWDYGYSDYDDSDYGYGPIIVRPVARFAVSYHIEGTRRMHLESHRAAHRTMDYLRSLGAHVRFRNRGGHYLLVYSMHGRALRRFYSDRSAHAFERRLERLGFHAHVRH
ncbi:MAG: hypothetical protein ACE5KM_09285 [Planctomycetaceae bacterium]